MGNLKSDNRISGNWDLKLWKQRATLRNIAETRETLCHTHLRVILLHFIMFV